MIQAYRLVYPFFSVVITLRHTILLEEEREAIGHMARLVHLWWHRESTHDQRRLCLCDTISPYRGPLMLNNSPFKGAWLQIVQERLDSAEHFHTRQHALIRAYQDHLTAWERTNRPLPVPYNRWIPLVSSLAGNLQRWQSVQRDTIAREMRVVQNHMQAWWTHEQSAPLTAHALLSPRPPRADCQQYFLCHNFVKEEGDRHA